MYRGHYSCKLNASIIREFYVKQKPSGRQDYATQRALPLRDLAVVTSTQSAEHSLRSSNSSAPKDVYTERYCEIQEVLKRRKFYVNLQAIVSRVEGRVMHKSKKKERQKEERNR